MAKLPKISLSDKLTSLIDNVSILDTHRGYLGMSQAGHKCDRYLWIVFHDVYRGSYSKRTKRIFERGNWEEHRVIRDLESVGAEIYDEQREVSLCNGEVLGHIDGIVRDVPYTDGTPVLLEIKAVNSNAWSKFKNKPTIEASHTYYTQMQLYMYCLDLNKALLVVVNKDNELRLWKLVEYEQEFVEKQIKRLEKIINSRRIPEKLGGPDWYQCKMCTMFDFCHANAITRISCRSCSHMKSKECMLGVSNVNIDIGCEDAWEDITR